MKFLFSKSLSPLLVWANTPCKVHPTYRIGQAYVLFMFLFPCSIKFSTSSLSTFLPITDEIGYLAGFRSISGFFSISCLVVFFFFWAKFIFPAGEFIFKIVKIKCFSAL
jgi:hypothetical protein